MKVTVYNGISDAHEVREIKDGFPLKTALSEEECSRALAFINGRQASVSDVPKEGDGVLIRVMPGASVATAIAIGALAVAAIGGAVAGYKMYQQKKALAKMQEEMSDLNEKTNSKVDNRPFLRGAGNSVATGKSQPYVMGRHMFTPYLLTHKWYELEGELGQDQFVTQCLECGFNKLVFETINADEVNLKSFDPTEVPQEGDGTLDDCPLSRGGTYEIAQDGNDFSSLTICNTRIYSETPQKQIPFQSSMADPSSTEEDTVYALDPYAKDVSVGITFPNGHYRIDEESGKKLSDSCTIKPAYSLDGGATWTDFPSASLFNQYIVTRHETRREYKTYSFVEEWLVTADDTHPYFPTPVLPRHPEFFGWKLSSKSAGGITRKMVSHFGTTSAQYRCTRRVYFYYYKDVSYPVYSWTKTGSFSHNTTDEIRFQASHSFTWQDYETLKANGQQNIYVRIRNLGTKDTQRINTAYTLFVQSRCFDPDLSNSEDGFVDCPVINERERQYAAILAIRLKANEANSDNLGKINIVVNSVARTWNSENDEWSAEKTPTSNPAAILLELLTSDCHPLSKFNDEEIDLEAFGELYEYCDAKCFEFNAVQTNKTTKENLIDTVCAVCQATVYYNLAGLLSVAYDHAQENYVASLTPDSLIEVSVKKEMSFPVDAIRMTYTDAETWTEKTHIILYDQTIPFSQLGADAVIQELSVTGVEKLVHVEQYARYMLAVSRLRLKTVSVTVGREGACFTPYTRIRVQDDALGTTAQDLIITKATLNGDMWVLECSEYNPNIYEAGKLTEYVSTIQQPKAELDELPEAYARKGELDEAVSDISTGDIDPGIPDAPAITGCVASRDGIKLSASILYAGLRNSVGSVNWQFCKPPQGSSPDDWQWENLADTSTLDGEYIFDRSEDGYPESTGLSAYRFRCRVVNTSGNEGEWSNPSTVSTEHYGTWALNAPAVNASVSSRYVTLKLSQPPRADGKELYGNIRYRVEVMRPDTDHEYYKPATGLNPYAAEANYKDGTGYVISDGTYIQVMPLKGQDTELIENTLYMFRITAENEAGTSQSTEVNTVAECDSIRDIVKAKETAKEAYISQLSAISANMGTISGGSFNGSQTNYWELSSFVDDNNVNHHEGAFRIGGEDEYMVVIPVDANGNDITSSTPASVRPASYRIEFKVGNFNVTASATEMTGDLLVMQDGDPNNRARITPKGIFFETKSADGQWIDVVHQSKTGTVSPSLQAEETTANGSLVITNATMAQRRANGSDIGLPLPSGDAEVWHFDSDFYNQHGVQTLVIGTSTDPDRVDPELVGEFDEVPVNAGINTFTPALLAVAPYSTLARSIYGNYSLTKTIATSNDWQVEFWMKQVWMESQTLFDIGNAQQKITLKIVDEEPNYNDPLSGEPSYNNETAQAELIPYNTILDAHADLEYASPAGTERRSDITFNMNSWYHIGIFCHDGYFTVFISEMTTRSSYAFEQNVSFVSDITLSINPSKKLMCIDELMVSPTVAGSTSQFNQNTNDRIPFGALNKDEKHFVLDVDNSKVWTNLFDDENVQDKIRNIVGIEKSYIRDQNILDEMEEITIPSDENNPLEFEYDGFLYLNRSSTSSSINFKVYLNGIEIHLRGIYAAYAGIPFVKGDTLYLQSNTASSLNTATTRVRYYKLRDYMGR